MDFVILVFFIIVEEHAENQFIQFFWWKKKIYAKQVGRYKPVLMILIQLKYILKSYFYPPEDFKKKNSLLFYN